MMQNSSKLKRYPQAVIATNNPNAKDVLIIIEKFQSLGAGCGRESRLHVHFSQTPNTKLSVHNAPADEWLVPLWLIETPYKRPHLNMVVENELDGRRTSTRISSDCSS